MAWPGTPTPRGREHHDGVRLRDESVDPLHRGGVDRGGAPPGRAVGPRVLGEEAIAVEHPVDIEKHHAHRVRGDLHHDRDGGRSFPDARQWFDLISTALIRYARLRRSSRARYKSGGDRVVRRGRTIAGRPPRAEDGGEATVHRVAERRRVLNRLRIDV